MQVSKEVLMEVKNLRVEFKGGSKKPFVAVDDISFKIYRGETFGLVGESGSGKTSIGRAMVRINEAAGGEILFKGQRINGLISKELDREVTQKIQMIFQDPMASLNERAKVDYIVAEGLYNTKAYQSEAERKAMVSQALLAVGLLPEFADTEDLFANPLHPYTRSLLSAVPIPDPALEQAKVIIPYDPQSHDYAVHKPSWVEVTPKHFVLGNATEIQEYRQRLA